MYLKIIGYLLTFLCLGVISAFLAFNIINPDSSGEVPQLVGKSLKEAADDLNRNKLFLSIEEKEYHGQIPEGHIIRQKLKPGEKVKAGTYVGVVVSRGQETYSLPSFEGQLIEDAKLTLGNLGIRLAKVTSVHSDSVAKGVIIAQRPLSGNTSANEINFLVSLGPYMRTYSCPSFVNMTVQDARKLAGELGIELEEKDSGSKVIFQKPVAGTVIRNGDTVEVKLGRGWGIWF